MSAPEEFGSYLVYEQLGVGGMARVHIAESRGLRKRVALKRLLPHAAATPELVRSFIHEARLVGHLKHTNIAQTYDFGKVGDTYFIAMELVPGPTVGQLIRQCNATVGVIPFPITLNILCQVCDALAYAHTLADDDGTPLGLIHRDVSPPNIIISNTGTVKLIDFGVAKFAKSTLQTMVGTVKGKFSYMAPEYLNGQLDSRVDLWALGAVAHELLTNRMLFDAVEDVGVLDKVKRAPIPPPSRFNPEVPRDLDAVVLTALQRNPAERWQSAGAMRTALANVALELETAVTNEQMIEWIEWAFTQTPGNERSGVSQLIELLEKPSKPGRNEPAAVAPTLKLGGGGSEFHPLHLGPGERTVRGRKSSSKRAEEPPRRRLLSTPRIGAAMVKRHATGRGLLILLLLLLVAAGVAAVIYFWGIPPDVTQSF